MSVFTDTDKTDVDGRFSDFFCKCCDAFLCTVYKVNSLKCANLIYETLLKILSEACSVCDRKINILIKVKHFNAFPLNAWLFYKSFDCIKL